MIKKYLPVAFLVVLFITAGNAGAQTRFYGSSGGEMIFSFAKIDHNGSTGQNILRWSPVFNTQGFLNADFGNAFGLIAGLGIKNVGFIDAGFDPDNSAVKKKFRTYNLGIPVGIKLGNLRKFFLFGGYEIEFPFHYKEKTFINGQKTDSRISTWFTSRVPSYYNTVFAGIQFPMGLTLKFKYYFTGFFNENFTETVNGVEMHPYEGYKVNILYFSLSFDLFQNPFTEEVLPKRHKTPDPVY